MDIAQQIRTHADRYDTGDPADAAVFDVLVRAAEVMERDTDREQS